jgi:hypothetical protein
MSTPQAKAIYNTSRWRNVTRIEALERDGHKCRGCGCATKTVHHQPPIETLLAQGLDPFDVQWCISLCSHCNGVEDGARAHPPKPAKVNRFAPWL